MIYQFSITNALIHFQEPNLKRKFLFYFTSYSTKFLRSVKKYFYACFLVGSKMAGKPSTRKSSAKKKHPGVIDSKVFQKAKKDPLHPISSMGKC